MIQFLLGMLCMGGIAVIVAIGWWIKLGHDISQIF